MKEGLDHTKKSAENLSGVVLYCTRFLSAVQLEFRRHVNIDGHGNISGTHFLRLNHPIIEAKQKAAKLGLADGYLGIPSKTIDIQVVNGAIIFTYDSRTTPYKAPRGEQSTKERGGVTYSLIGVDINPERRDSKITPTVTLHHEFQHHLNVALGDSIVFTESGSKYPSLERKSERFMGYGTGARSRHDLYIKDRELIEGLMGRPLDLSEGFRSTDALTYENQLYYFDELSASFGQGKGNTLGPKCVFYNNRPHPLGDSTTHYDLIGGHPKDQEELKLLFRDYLMPLWVIHSFLIHKIHAEIGKIQSRLDASLHQGNHPQIRDLESYENDLKYVVARVTQILGQSRTVHQAYALIRGYWESECSRLIKGNDLNIARSYRDANMLGYL